MTISTNDSFRALQALVTRRREQQTAFERRSTPDTHAVPQTGHST
nr:hypothetical protein [Streptomyces sp. SID5914]